MKRTATTLSTFQFITMFPDEESAVSFVERELWKDCPICPRCKSKRSYPIKRIRGHRCSDCRSNYTVRMGTLFESSKLPLKHWLYAMYLLATARKGVSSLQLSKELGVTQKSAWFVLHRLREACSGDGILLSGIVEVDETYIGGKETNKHAGKKTRGSFGGKGKSAVLGMREREGKVKAIPIPDTSGKTLTRALRDNIKRPGVICTDEAAGYSEIGGYTRYAVNHSAKQYVDGWAHTNGIESVWAVVKRGFYGTYHQFSRKHLHRYVDEFTFRLNEGNCGVDTIERIKHLVNRAADHRLTYQGLIERKQ